MDMGQYWSPSITQRGGNPLVGSTLISYKLNTVNKFSSNEHASASCCDKVQTTSAYRCTGTLLSVIMYA